MTVGEWKQFLSDKDDCRIVYYNNEIIDITKIGLGCEHLDRENRKEQEENYVQFLEELFD